MARGLCACDMRYSNTLRSAEVAHSPCSFLDFAMLHMACARPYPTTDRYFVILGRMLKLQNKCCGAFVIAAASVLQRLITLAWSDTLH